MVRSRARERIQLKQRLRQMLLVLILVVLWIMLWESVTPLVVVSGVVVGVIVVRTFYLPPFEFSGRVNVFWLVVFLGWFTYHLVAASAQVAWTAIRPRRIGDSAVVEVNLHVRSDLLLTVIAQTSSLIPGSFVIEADRARSALFLHVLDCDSQDDVTAAVKQTLKIEFLLTAALGSSHDLEVLNEWRESRGEEPVLTRRSLQGRRLVRKRAARARRAAKSKARAGQ